MTVARERRAFFATVGEGFNENSEGHLLKQSTASSDRDREQWSFVDLGFCKE